MNTIELDTCELDTWEDFLIKIDEVKNTNKKPKKLKRRVSKHLYRGQSNADFELLTTLERVSDTRYSLMQYYSIMSKIQGQIESIFGNKMLFPDNTKIKENIKNIDSFLATGIFGYEYMIYLRHHGFPSPLLDWTYSPYVAAFFAFKDYCKADKISIFSYQEYIGNGKSYSEDKPFIKALGPYISSHKRHYLQQSDYTVCVKKEKGNFFFEKHEDGFNSLNWRENAQDVLTKFTLPSSERTKVLKKLNSMNINAFSLFGSEESLMHSISVNEFLTKQ